MLIIAGIVVFCIGLALVLMFVRGTGVTSPECPACSGRDTTLSETGDWLCRDCQRTFVVRSKKTIA